jgi:hypothetical protein
MSEQAAQPSKYRRQANIILLCVNSCIAPATSPAVQWFLDKYLARACAQMPLSISTVGGKLFWLVQHCDDSRIHDAEINNSDLVADDVAPSDLPDYNASCLAHQHRASAEVTSWRSRVGVAMDQPGYLRDLTQDKAAMLQVAQVGALLAANRRDAASEHFRSAERAAATVVRQPYPHNRAEQTAEKQKQCGERIDACLTRFDELHPRINAVQRQVLESVAKERTRYHSTGA